MAAAPPHSPSPAPPQPAPDVLTGRRQEAAAQQHRHSPLPSSPLAPGSPKQAAPWGVSLVARTRPLEPARALLQAAAEPALAPGLSR
ncbi:hypothetical protein D5R93_10125 [Actinomyces lilanjuaniae]|uniref:Uncharacterized protein n=1 Tax=Actinomyces lilanjuaniae TaxID=2321394 RepID=A0ABM6Z4N7_9ACTO|nr:hypothetical protein D5R93_10125 [Actinomyces lilanjuaniae]